MADHQDRFRPGYWHLQSLVCSGFQPAAFLVQGRYRTAVLLRLRCMKNVWG